MKPWLVAHRGAPREAKENTLQAFAAAKKYPIAFIEFDVRVTKDDVAVIHHNPNIDDMVIAQYSYAELLKADSQLALFKDVITYNNDKPLMIELKGIGAAKHVVSYLHSHKDCFATSFLIDELLALIQADIGSDRLFLARRRPTFGLLRIVKKHHFGGITVQKWFAGPWLYYLSGRASVRIMIYTVNSVWLAQLIRWLYPKALICTDKPHRISRLK